VRDLRAPNFSDRQIKWRMFALWVGAASIGQAYGADIVGRASVIDGYMIEMHGERIRRKCGVSGALYVVRLINSVWRWRRDRAG
jgi:hypothetical protein